MAPIVGTFEADFSQFTSAVRGAETQLRSLEAGSNKVASSIDNVGGILRGLAGAFGIAFSAASVINFGRELLRTADELTKLSDRTGLSVRALQQFQIAGGDAGNTIGELSAAVVQMQDRLTGGGASVVKALGELGLKLSDLQALRGDQQLIAISDALRTIEDPAKQVNIAIDLMGRTGANVLPTLKRGFDDVRDGVVGMSQGSIDALDDFGDAITRTGRSMASFVGEHLGRSIEGWQILGRLFDDNVDNLNAVTAAAERAAPKMSGISPPGLPADLKAIEAGLEADRVALNKLVEDADRGAKELREFANWIGEREIEAHRMALDAQEQQEREYREFQNWVGERQMEDEGARLKQREEEHKATLARMAAAEAAFIGLTITGQGFGGGALPTGPALPTTSFGSTGLGGGGVTVFGPSSAGGPMVHPSISGSLNPGGVTVNINASHSFLNTLSDTQRLAETVGNSVKSQLMGHGRQVT